MSVFQRNGTSWADGSLEMFTGEEDIARLGEVASWQGSDTTAAYDGECGRVRGSADGLFPPGAAHVSDTLQLFSTDLCRPLTLAKAGSGSLHGVSVAKYELSKENFANGTVCPSNSCYHNNLPSGVQVTTTRSFICGLWHYVDLNHRIIMTTTIQPLHCSLSRT